MHGQSDGVDTAIRMAQNFTPARKMEAARTATPDHAYAGGSPVDIAVESLAASSEVIQASAATLSDQEKQRAARFVFDRDRNRYIVARAHLRRLLGVRLGIAPEKIELAEGAHGKPELGARLAGSGLRFNLSHSDDVAVYAFASRREVGIDVEALRVMNDAEAIAARFFSASENRTWLGLDQQDRTPGFFNCWTRKEAFVKAIGEGLGYPLDTFDVTLAPGEPARILRVKDQPGDACGWRLDAFSPAAGFVAAVVIEEG